jgi:hypothetical protein
MKDLNHYEQHKKFHTALVVNSSRSKKEDIDVKSMWKTISNSNEENTIFTELNTKQEEIKSTA